MRQTLPAPNPPLGRIVLYTVGGAAALTAIAFGVWYGMSERRRSSGPMSGRLISCARHHGKEICVWALMQGGYTYSITGGTASDQVFDDPTMAALAGRAFVEVLMGRPEGPQPA
jgi:hypothetical protein